MGRRAKGKCMRRNGSLKVFWKNWMGAYRCKRYQIMWQTMLQLYVMPPSKTSTVRNGLYLIESI